ncbi:MAG: hypothetical protein C4330_01645 [Chitinophagaceae bacterium]
MLKSVLLAFALYCVTAAFSQDVIRVQDCNSLTIRHQADSLKTLYAKDGFVVLKEASITMESEYEMPVIVPLDRGSWYQFVFIGEPTSRLYEVRMYDWNERQVVYQKKLWGDIDGNIISYSYVPQFSEFHMIKALQINKKQKTNLCGYVMLLKKTKAAGNANASPIP